MFHASHELNKEFRGSCCLCQSVPAALQPAPGGSSQWGWGIAQQSPYWRGDLELLRGDKMLKQTWQMKLSVQRGSTAQAWPLWVPAGLFSGAVAARRALAGAAGHRR